MSIFVSFNLTRQCIILHSNENFPNKLSLFQICSLSIHTEYQSSKETEENMTTFTLFLSHLFKLSRIIWYTMLQQIMKLCSYILKSGVTFVANDSALEAKEAGLLVLQVVWSGLQRKQHLTTCSNTHTKNEGSETVLNEKTFYKNLSLSTTVARNFLHLHKTSVWTWQF